MIPLLLICATGFSAWFWLRFCAAPASDLKSLVKTLSVALLALASLMSGLPTLLTAGLTLGAVGDFFLSRRGDRAFLAGLVAFALSHLAYVGLFADIGDGAALFAMPRAAVAAVILLAAMAMAAVLWPRAGALRVPVVVYIMIILAMVLAALSGQGGLIIAAALLFMLSDTVLSLDLFVQPVAIWWQRAAPYVIWGTYWAAQAGFLLAFL